MTESVAQETVAATPVKTPKAKKAVSRSTKVQVKKGAPTHPPTAQMVNAAIKNLKERGGSSLQAIKKYIAGTYKVDAEKVGPFIKKYLKSAVDNGKLIRTKGKGASGSFKLAGNIIKPEGVQAIVKPKKVKSVVKKTKTVKPKKKTKAAASPKKIKTPVASKTEKAVKPIKSKAAPKPKKEKLLNKPKKIKSPIVKKPVSAKSKKVTKKSATSPKK